MIRIAGFGTLLIALTLALQGCNSGYGALSSSSGACTLPSGMQAALVYPPPNSTANGSQFGQVIIATTGTLPTDWASWDVELGFPNAPIAPLFGTALTTAPSPLPSPAATPPFANPTYWKSAFGSVPTGTTMTAALNDLASNCSPPVTLSNFSS